MQKGEFDMKKIKIISILLLILSLFCTLDLGFNLLYNLIPEHLDGYTTHSTLQGLFGIFGDHSWSLSRFYKAFETSTWITFWLFVANVVLSFKSKNKI